MEIETPAGLEEAKTQVEEAPTQYLTGQWAAAPPRRDDPQGGIACPQPLTAASHSPTGTPTIEPRQVVVPGATTVTQMGPSNEGGGLWPRGRCSSPMGLYDLPRQLCQPGTEPTGWGSALAEEVLRRWRRTALSPAVPGKC